MLHLDKKYCLKMLSVEHFEAVISRSPEKVWAKSLHMRDFFYDFLNPD